MAFRLQKEKLEALYALYNRRSCVRPDPLQFLYDYPDLPDREIVALIASSLAYGRVNQITKSVSAVLNRMEDSPHEFLMNASRDRLRTAFGKFRYRFTTGEELVCLLLGVKGVYKRYGSLYAAFLDKCNGRDDTLLKALCRFVDEIRSASPMERNSLLPRPQKGSACKRLNLFLRWMVRQDDVDPGGWDRVCASDLIVPLDTHMHRIGLFFKGTERKQADMRTAMDITGLFKKIAPEDPVRYDFSLTRLGIRKDGSLDDLFGDLCGVAKP